MACPYLLQVGAVLLVLSPGPRAHLARWWWAPAGGGAGAGGRQVGGGLGGASSGRRRLVAQVSDESGLRQRVAPVAGGLNRPARCGGDGTPRVRSPGDRGMIFLPSKIRCHNGAPSRTV
jgi:hypothetical protein